jgi:hypothetical protein
LSPRSFSAALEQARSWASDREFSGYDPYDALRSPLLVKLHGLLGRPFGIAATQIVRRSPVNFRPLLRITPAVNAKGLALFLSAAARTGRRDETRTLAERLRIMRAPGWDLPCWGYPFPWRARAFYLPSGTPTIVATSFVGEAFLDAYSLLGDSRDLELALGACRFVLEKLHKTEDATGTCLSYSPLDTSAVYNASILGARLLVRAGRAARRDDLIQSAGPLVRFVLARQQADGSWPYGAARFHRWIDSFHTGFVLSALDVFARATGDPAAGSAVGRGATIYAERFFGPAGEPYYYSDRSYPYDVHSAAQGVITLAQLRDIDPAYGALAERVGRFLVDRYLAVDGHFRYQIRRTHRVSIPYMRWSQAWGVRGLAALVEIDRS